jgi:hypothetical protein
MEAVSVEFASRAYWLCFAAAIFARGMDFLSTWVATPNLELEANPIARWLGWKRGIALNVALCFGFAFVPITSIIVTTTSILVAARNFQSAWMMRTMGEAAYRDWYLDRLLETPLKLYLGCLLANAGLTALVGVVLVVFSNFNPVAIGIGVGIVGYALAVLVYTLVSVWRVRR